MQAESPHHNFYGRHMIWLAHSHLAFSMEATPRAKRYHRHKMMLGLAGYLLEAAFLLVLAFSPLSRRIAGIGSGLPGGYAVQLAVYLLIFMFISEFLSMPVAFARGYWLERRYGLSRQTMAGWVADHAKALLLNLVFTLVLAEILYSFLYFGGQWWWVWTGMIFSALFVILARLAPVLIFPLFFKFKPLESGSLRDRLQRLTEKSRTPVTGIFEMDLSRKSNTVNAALAGIGKGRRIILADTLLQRFSEEEIEVVVAHEIGHHHHGHLAKGIALQTASIFLFLFLVDHAASHWAVALHYNGLRDIAALPLLALTAVGMGLIGTPLLNFVLRHFERQADRYSVRLTGMPQAFESTMRRLAAMNLADPSPNSVIEALFYSHPSIQKRLRLAEQMSRGDQ